MIIFDMFRPKRILWLSFPRPFCFHGWGRNGCRKTSMQKPQRLATLWISRRAYSRQRSQFSVDQWAIVSALKHRPGFTGLHNVSCWIWPCYTLFAFQFGAAGGGFGTLAKSRWRNGHWRKWMRAVEGHDLTKNFFHLPHRFCGFLFQLAVPRCWQFWTSCALSCLYSPHVLWRVKLSRDLLMNSSGKMKNFEVTSSKLCGPATASLSFCYFWSLWSTPFSVGFREFHIQQPSFWAGVQLFSPLGHFCKC